MENLRKEKRRKRDFLSLLFFSSFLRRKGIRSVPSLCSGSVGFRRGEKQRGKVMNGSLKEKEREGSQNWGEI